MSIFGNKTEDQGRRDRWTQLKETVANGLRNFQILARSLKEIRDTQLYTIEFATFDDACRATWNITARYADRLIAALDVVTQIGPAGQELSERAVRPLTSLPPDQRAAAIAEAVRDGLTPRAIEQAARKHGRRKTTRPRPLRIRVPGGSVRIDANRKSPGPEQMLRHAIAALERRAAA